MADHYKILSQTQVIDGQPGTPMVPAMEIRFETLPSHSHATVRIPLTAYTPSEVHATLEPIAQNIEAVAGL